MKIIFMGTPDFSVPALQRLHQAHDIAAVYCQPPRPAGRGKADREGPVHLAADALGLPVHHPVSLRSETAQQIYAAHAADIAVVVAYGLILPQAVLDMPRLGCLNIHASLLPRWRGAAPIHRAVMAGDDQTGICIMRMEAGLDTGAVLMRQAIPIGAEDTTGDLHDRLADLGASLVVQTLTDLPNVVTTPQSDDGITYATKIDKAEARVDWTRPAIEVDRQIRGLSPFPGAWCLIGHERVKLLRSRLAAGSAAPGQILSGLTIACGDGAVEVTDAQREGKRPMKAAEFLRGIGQISHVS
jgi:methionyl-tRNA formyltransferase